MADASITLKLPWFDRHGAAYVLEDGVTLSVELPERLVPFDPDLWDYKVHRCGTGDTLMGIAQRYYGQHRFVSWPVGLWEVIAQANEPPIADAFAVLPVGRELYIPGPDYIQEVALGDSLRDSPVLV